MNGISHTAEFAKVDVDSTATTRCDCFHCGLPVPAGLNLRVDIDGRARDMCCHGCLAVAEAIIASGHLDYYRTRTAMPVNPDELLPDFIANPTVYDRPSLRDRYVRRQSEDVSEATLSLEGVTCSACVWLIEQHLAKHKAIVSASINYVTRRAHVEWYSTEATLADVISAIGEVGYRATPYEPVLHQEQMAADYEQSLKRLVVAGIFGMQIMILAVALYLADGEIDARYADLFRWASLTLCTPILLYSAAPFFQRAWSGVVHRAIGMDVPVSLGIIIAFAGSVFATVSGAGEVYFDSVAMFVFFLLIARHVELLARMRSGELLIRINSSVVDVATRVLEDGSEELVPACELQTGDLVRIKSGQVIPADATIVEGRSTLDESLLTGESVPVYKEPGNALIGGSVNIENTLLVRVSSTTEQSFASQLMRLIERAQAEKSPIAGVADRVAGYFIGAVLLCAVCVAWYWWRSGTSDWLVVTMSVLIVTCPCALSLATPAAITSFVSALAKRGAVVGKGHAAEALARSTHVVFDKTGTLTRGELTLVDVATLGGVDRASAHSIAAALEENATHPIAAAIRSESPEISVAATELSHSTGGGVQGVVQGERWYLGSPDYLHGQASVSTSEYCPDSTHRGCSQAWLARDGELVAVFYLADSVREEAGALAQHLLRSGRKVSILSGDSLEAVARAADELAIKQYDYRLTPDQKYQHIQQLQADGDVVAMIGDGMNDSAALACADVSIAMSQGADLAKTSADVILLNNSLQSAGGLFSLAERTLSVIRQNLLWAAGYNVLALPFAAMGYVAPWMAAIGMSISSLVVVLNATRVGRA